jgi:hypothetical protein
MYMHRTTSDAAGNGLCTTTKCMRGAAGIGMGTTIKHLRRTASGAAGNGLGATMKYTCDAQRAPPRTMPSPPCSVAAFIFNSEPHTGARQMRSCFFLPQPRQPGGSLGLKGLVACYHGVVLAAALEAPNDLSSAPPWRA